MKMYNGEDLILGRLASLAAKQALLGEEVIIVNCEKMIVSGNKAGIFAKFKQFINRGGYPLKSQNISRLPERYVRRCIRGMLPWKQARGKEAFRRVMCYRGMPDEFAGKEMVVTKGISMQKLPTLYYTTVGEMCKINGGKF
ncbi:MAG: 50S ribosomal protein L13 [Nanoarchaeota archaeon]|nr:50S ribosomal protein L13 [Nanoarchaeota archaeon]